MLVLPPTHPCFVKETVTMGSQPSCAEDEVPEELLAPWEWRGWARSSDALGNYESFLQPLQTAQIIRTQHVKDILVWGVSPACATTNGTFTHLQETERAGRWTICNKASCHFITPHVLPSSWDFVLGGIQAWPFQPAHIKKVSSPHDKTCYPPWPETA